MPKIITKITSPILSGYYTHWRKNAVERMSFFNTKANEIAKELQLPPNVEVRFRIIPARMNASGIAYPPEWKNMQYVVDVDVRQSRRSFFHTLLHEMVHVEQFHTDKLIIGDGNVMWKGKLYEQVHDVHSAANAKQPWEIEANLKAIKLYKLLKA
jgi:hypothetical protein